MYRSPARTVLARVYVLYLHAAMHLHSIPPKIRVAAAAGVLVLAGCTSGGGAFRAAEGPYLSPGPLPGAGGGDLVVSPAVPAGTAAHSGIAGRAGGEAGMPAGLHSGQGTERLPGAGMPGIGPVNGLVIPVSLGPQLPLRDDAALTREFFGADPGTSGPTLVEQMLAISGGLFRPSFDVLPTLVDSRGNVLSASPSPRELLDFVQAVLRSAAQRTDLSRWDNDGPDGMPASRDDDGRLDFVMLVIESDATFPSVTIRQELALTTPGGSVNSGPVHVLSLSRSEVADLRPAVGLWLDGLGLDPGERFFPSTFPRGISSLARARLGWLSVQPVVAPGAAVVAEEQALLFPLQDVGPGGGFWLAERAGDVVFASRVARKGDGHFFATEAHMIRPGEAKTLPLTRQFGERGPRVELRWPAGSAGPDVEFVSVPVRPADPQPLRRTAQP